MTQQEIDARIAELEQERDRLLETTEFKWLGKKTSTHTVIKQRYNKRIRNLKNHGVEVIGQSEETKAKRKATNLAKYGANCNVKKMLETKMQRYGHAFGDKDKIKQHKIERYGNAMGDVDKLIKSKLEKYGNIYGPNAIRRARETLMARFPDTGGINMQRILEVKRDKYGCVYVNPQKRMQTNIEKYGAANGNAKLIAEHKMETYGNIFGPNAKSAQISKLNIAWKELIEKELNCQVELEYAIGMKQFDLRINDILIEINPAISHNSTYSYAYVIGLADENYPIAADYHLNKTIAARQAGFKCIHVWPWDDEIKIVRLLKANFAADVDADFTVDYIDSKTAMHFIQYHCMQHIGKRNRIYVALKHDNDILLLIAFHKLRAGNANYEIDIIAYSNIHAICYITHVIEQFIATYKPATIVYVQDDSKYDFAAELMAANFTLHNTVAKRHIFDMQQQVCVDVDMVEYPIVEIFDAGQSTFVWHAK